MKNRMLIGIIAMLSAPFLGIDIFMNGMGVAGSEYVHSTLGGFFYLIYMSGWMLCIYTLYDINAAGIGVGRHVLVVQLIFLTIANLSNGYEIVYPSYANESVVYHVMDIFWPISNLTMIATGFYIVRAKVIEGWRRYVPLIVGSWIPCSIIAYFVIGDTNRTFELFVACYSIAAWSLLGYATATARTKDETTIGERYKLTLALKQIIDRHNSGGY